MAIDIVLRPEAALDIARICDWYDGQRPQLGDEFLDAIDGCFQMLSAHPEMCPIVFESYRRFVMTRFPYVVFYEYSTVITIFGVFHSARDTRVWRERLARPG